MCWTPAIIPTQSRTVFVNIIDCVVSSVVEQVYSSTFKFYLLKMQEVCALKRFIFTSKCTKVRLVAGLRRIRRGSFQHHQPPSWIKGEGGEWKRGRGEGEEGKEEVPPMSEVR